jgi:hypothetical protein
MKYYSKLGVILKDNKNYNHTMALNSYKGFTDNIKDFFGRDSIRFIQLKPELYEEGKYREYKAMDWATLKDICLKNNCNLVVSLEDIAIYNEYKIEGYDTRYASTKIDYFAVWRIYSPFEQKLIHETKDVDILYLENEINSHNNTNKYFPKRSDLMADVSYSIGEKFAKKIAPQWLKETRFIFTKNQNSDIALNYLRNNKTEKAIKYYLNELRLLDSKNKRNIHFLNTCYNLSVAYEYNSEFKKSLEWIERYKNMITNPTSQDIKTIKKRKEEINQSITNRKLLDSFFGN